MKSGIIYLRLGAMACFVVLPALSQEPMWLSASRSNASLALSWPAMIQKPDGSVVRPYFELQRSYDFQHWQPVSERQRAVGVSGNSILSATFGLDEPHAFYRLLSIEPSSGAKLGSGGAEVLGYGPAFAQELQRIGQISPEQFTAMFPHNASYLSGVSW